MMWHPASARPILLYRGLRAAARRPALLESLGPRTPFCRRTLLGADPVSLAEVRGGRLFVDGVERGQALDLFDLLEETTVTAGGADRSLPAGRAARSAGGESGVFPCWIGFLSYEFARHVDLPANDPLPGLPEASFRLYSRGWVWEDDTLVESPAEEGGSVGGGGTVDAGGIVEASGAVDAGGAITASGITGEGEPPDGRPTPGLPPIEVVSDFPPDEFLVGVQEVQERIRAGWVYQVNLSHRFHFDARGVDPLVCYERLREVNPSPFFGIIESEGEGDRASAGADASRGDEASTTGAKGWAVVSGSPERLFDIDMCEGAVTARPIAGTRRRAAAPDEDDALEAEMRADRKERAEHVMLVDLLRNDLSRVCEVGSVEVSEAFTVERYSHVMHLVSEVVGKRRSDARLRDAVASIFPGGTITGAPKESVMNEIARLEPVARGAYTGAMGYVSRDRVDFNILIRSFTFAGLERDAADPGRVLAGTGYLSGGGGIVIESDPEFEYLETRHKVEALLHILGHGRLGEAPAAPRPIDSWRPPRPRGRYGARVLLVENHDSFSYNIVNYLRMLGAEVEVIDQLVGPDEATGVAALRAATHILVGPGPGDPWTAGRTLDWVTAALDDARPFLGVCLGHQALGVHCGARLRRAPRPVHGEDHLMRHSGRGVLAGVPDPAPFTRYNSLVLEEVPAVLTVEAWSHPDDGRIAEVEPPFAPVAAVAADVTAGGVAQSGGVGPGTGGDSGAAAGLVMAVAHRERPAWGVQFHPESMLSPHGLDLLANFLETR